jgi:uncharacterized DUF497 family protein
MTLKFEWDEAKSAKDAAKHGLPFGEAVATLADRDRAGLERDRSRLMSPTFNPAHPRGSAEMSE